MICLVMVGLSFVGCSLLGSLTITQWEKSSDTIVWNSFEDYLLSWKIKITVSSSGEDLEAGRASLVVNLYDENGRYDSKREDDLGPISAGWGATYSFTFLVDQNYGPDNVYGEALLFIDGKEVDKVVMHF